MAGDLALKMKLEMMIRPSIRRLLGQMNSDFGRFYAATGQIIQTTDYRPEWQALFANHYRRIFNQAIRSVKIKSIKQDEPLESIVEDDDAIAAAFLLFGKRNAEEQARLVTETSRRQMSDSITQAESEFRADNPADQVTNKEISDRARRILADKDSGRVTTIGNVNTQAPLERLKQIAVRVIAGIPVLALQVVQPAEVRKVTKSWLTQGDELVRPAHVSANGQTRPESSPFNVGGELLAFPSDTSLGATAGNTINCRCSAIYNVT